MDPKQKALKAYESAFNPSNSLRKPAIKTLLKSWYLVLNETGFNETQFVRGFTIVFNFKLRAYNVHTLANKINDDK